MAVLHGHRRCSPRPHPSRSGSSVGLSSPREKFTRDFIVKLDAIPAELQGRDQWLLWSHDSDPPKAPLNADGYLASWTDPTEWLTFTEATELARTNDQFDGIGFTIAEGDPYVGIDLDDCLREPFQPKPKEWLPALDAFNGTYVEYSQSGTGLHPFVKADRLPAWWSNQHFTDDEHEGVEAYTRKFFIMTGRPVDDLSAPTIAEVDVAPFLSDAYEAITGSPPSLPGGDDRPDTDAALSIYDVISRNSYPEGENRSHPFHPSGTGQNFRVDPGAETFRCWRHEVTGNAYHLLGIKHDVIDCGDWANGGLPASTWREIMDTGRAEGYDIPSPRQTTTDRHAIDGNPTWKHVARELGVDPTETDGRDDALSGHTDKALAGALWECIHRSDIEIRVIESTNRIWYYDHDRGVWTQDARSYLASIARSAFGPTHYGKNVLTELASEAAADERVWADPDDFGLAPGRVLVENGILDLQAATDGAGLDALSDPTPDDLATRLLPVTYNPDAEYDTWAEYVTEWAEDGRAATLQEYVGYCLHVGGLPIHRALLLVGEGRNGKGTFLHVVRQLLGEDNTTSIDLQTLAKRTFARPPFHTAIANIDDDLSSASFGAGGLGMFKKLVAGDPVWAERKGKDGFSFTPTGKHLYAANTVPDVNVSDDDVAFWERWEVVEFPNYYPPGERDPNLRHHLAENLSGVLNWAIDGWGRLMDNGRFTGELETWEKRDYWRRYGETIEQFIDECVTHDLDAPNIPSGDVYQVYVAYCENHNETPDSQHKLTGKLKAAGYTYKESVRVGDRTPRGFTNLALTEDAPDVSFDRPDTMQGRLKP